MKTKALFVLLLFAGAMARGQFKEVKTYQAGEQTLAQGDSFELGQGTGLEGAYVYVMTKPKTFAPAPQRLGPGYAGASFAIDQVLVLKKPVGGLDGASIVFEMRGQKMMVPIREGLESGEIILRQ